MGGRGRQAAHGSRPPAISPRRGDRSGVPDIDSARREMSHLRRLLPPRANEDAVRHRVWNILESLFPEYRVEGQPETGSGPADLVCNNIVIETKAPGTRLGSGSPAESPREQAVRCIDAMSPRQAPDGQDTGWKACITNGLTWQFYEYDASLGPKGAGERLVLLRTIECDSDEGCAAVLEHLYNFVNRKARPMPPLDTAWIEPLEAEITAAARSARASPGFRAKIRLWERLLRGSRTLSLLDEPDRVALFARHTLLIVISRMIAGILVPGHGRTPHKRPQKWVLDGFPGWMLDSRTGQGGALYRRILEAVSGYEWRAAGRDVLKDLYHNTIPPRLRHDYGEYYTPDWLAQAICEEVMDEGWCRSALANAMNGIHDHTVMDPSCGSGTFLYHAVRRLQDAASRVPGLAGDTAHQSEIITRIVVGIDIHPVAVELARATKVMALAHVGRFGGLSHNVFLGDSAQWDARTEARALGVILTQIPIDDKRSVFLPSEALLEGDVEGKISAFFRIAEAPEGEFRPQAAADLFGAGPGTEYRPYVLDACEFFHREIVGRRNHVWKHYLLNLVQPFRLRQRARPAGGPHHTLLVGNPPWVVYNSIADTGRQDEFRRHATGRGVWSGGSLATQNDLAATFVAACVDHYLGNGGKFGFVLPYSAIRGRQWAPFRTGRWDAKKSGIESRMASLTGAWDLSGVRDPPFPQAASCVMFGSKSADSSALAPGAVLAFRNREGKRVTPSMRWPAARLALDMERLRSWKTAPSAYLGKFRNGATLFPQALAVCDPDETHVRKAYTTFRTRKSKGAWAGLALDGRVETRFVYAGAFSKNIVPFGLVDPEWVIAPDVVDKKLRKDKLPDGRGASLFRSYWTVADLEWSRRRQRSAPPTLAGQLDYNGKFSSQFSARAHKFRVIYNKSGSFLQSAVIPDTVGGRPVVVDGTAYWHSSRRPDELHYLCAVLNAASLQEFFSGACRMSDRDFHTGPLESCPIPAYDAKDALHRGLARLSRACHSRVAAMRGGAALSRRAVMGDAGVAAAMPKIDEAVRRLLPGQASAG